MAMLIMQKRTGDGIVDPSQWFTIISDGSSALGQDVVVDASNDIYLVGYTGSARTLQMKVSEATPSISWQRLFALASSGKGITLDSSDNVVVTGETDFGSAATIAMYNNSGAIQWQRKLTNVEIAYSAAADTSGNTYVAAYSIGGTRRAVLLKYNNTGVLQWQRELLNGTGGFVNFGIGHNISVDSNGDVVSICRHSDAGTSKAALVKWNSSGVLQWQRQISSVSQTPTVTTFGTDIYVGGMTTLGPDSGNLFAMKCNTSGVLQWVRAIGGAVVTPGTRGTRVAADATSVYVAGQGTATDSSLIAKWDTSGSLQWQRQISNSEPWGMAVDGLGRLIVTGMVEGDSDVMLARLASDGSGAGTYGSFVYSATSETEQAGTLTNVALTGTTEQAGTATDAAGTQTDSAGSTILTKQ